MPPDLNDPSDESILIRIGQQDPAALELLHRRYSDLVYTIALNVCGQDSDAQAVLVTVFWEVWQFPNRWNPQRGSVRMYLYVLTRSRARDLRRSQTNRNQRQRLHQEPLSHHLQNLGQIQSPNAAFSDSIVLERVRTAVDNLPEKMKTVVQMAFFDGLSHPEIAEELSTPLGTVKSRIRRALERLNQHFVSDQDGR